jgi:cupin fold WbuC family metalloprotein
MSTLVKQITTHLIGDLVAKAWDSPRRRVNHNFHNSFDENPNRFLNVMVEQTYVAPHRHLDPPKPESFVVLEGRVGFLMFDDQGNITERYVAESGTECLGIDMAPGVWHSLVVLSGYAVLYEVKPGPYVPATDKDFATWAPREGEPGWEDYLGKLLNEFSTGLHPVES